MKSMRIQRIAAAFFFVDSLAVLAIWAGNLAAPSQTDSWPASRKS